MNLKTQKTLEYILLAAIVSIAIAAMFSFVYTSYVSRNASTPPPGSQTVEGQLVRQVRIVYIQDMRTTAFIPCAVYPDVALDCNWKGAITNGAN